MRRTVPILVLVLLTLARVAAVPGDPALTVEVTPREATVGERLELVIRVTLREWPAPHGTGIFDSVALRFNLSSRATRRERRRFTTVLRPLRERTHTRARRFLRRHH